VGILRLLFLGRALWDVLEDEGTGEGAKVWGRWNLRHGGRM
jgi:hypothetical protein